MSASIKYLLTKKSVKVDTHNGVFHADDTTAVMLLVKVGLPVHVTRTRNGSDEEQSAHILLDKGRIYDDINLRLDHHQKGFTKKHTLFYDGKDVFIPYATAGLVWDIVGMDLCKGDKGVYNTMLRTFIIPIDAADNGVSLTGNEFGISPMTLSSMVAAMNPDWNETGTPDDYFWEAVRFVGKHFDVAMKRARGVALAKSIVEGAVKSKISPSVIILDQFCPYAGHLVDHIDINFVVFHDRFRDEWRVKTVSKMDGTFASRADLPEKWAGLSGEELQEVTGVEDAIFCHIGKFICGAESLEGAKKLALLAEANVN